MLKLKDAKYIDSNSLEKYIQSVFNDKDFEIFETINNGKGVPNGTAVLVNVTGESLSKWDYPEAEQLHYQHSNIRAILNRMARQNTFPVCTLFVDMNW